MGITTSAREAMASSGAQRRRIEWPVVASYVFDWVVVIVIAGIAGGIGEVTPNMRPFSLNDPDISFPYATRQACPPWLLVVLALVLPAVVILLLTMLLIPGSTTTGSSIPSSLLWRRRLWELHAGWLGLGLSLASVFFFTNGMKNMFGKPRPDLLARCRPNPERRFRVGGWGAEDSVYVLYSADVCTSTDMSTLHDGFRSYPSGHSSFSAAGLVYLTLFLASKFGVLIPFVASRGDISASSHAAFPSRMHSSLSHGTSSHGHITKDNGEGVDEHHQTLAIRSIRRQAAAPPVYLLVLTLVPFCISIWIAASRWYDFRHHGFDILFGYLMGVVTAFFSFRFYHLSISQGAGWAWGPRSRGRAFWAGVGKLGYVENDDAAGWNTAANDLHHGHGFANGNGAAATSSSSGRAQHESMGNDLTQRNGTMSTTEQREEVPPV